jgi:putative hydrolases of HD superfamily
MPGNLSRQIEFILEIDKLKAVLRRTYLLTEKRRENSAEHSWHTALAGLLLAEHADLELDCSKLVKMLLVHDLVEIDAGDTFCYDRQGMEGKAEREQQAAERIFGILPETQGAELMSLWLEFEACQTNEAKFAALMDRVTPLLYNFHGKGGSWKEHGVTSAQVRDRIASVPQISKTVEAFLFNLVERAVEAGYLEE